MHRWRHRPILCGKNHHLRFNALRIFSNCNVHLLKICKLKYFRLSVFDKCRPCPDSKTFAARVPIESWVLVALLVGLSVAFANVGAVAVHNSSGNHSVLAFKKFRLVMVQRNPCLLMSIALSQEIPSETEYEGQDYPHLGQLPDALN